MKKLTILLAAALLTLSAVAQPSIRKETRLDGRQQIWRSVADDENSAAYDGFEQPGYDDSGWSTVTVPHNWDKYEGSRQLRHGNRHGTAWYRTEFTVWPEDRNGKRVFLYFEGVGSYGTVWVNGQKAGYHAGGRTTFTLDITDFVRYGEPNTLAVKAEHPPLIADLPWVCGACAGVGTFSEGSQPMGIFRPVTLVVTGDVRVEPFGIHVWNDTSINEERAGVHVDTEIKNYSAAEREVELLVRVTGTDGKPVVERRQTLLLPPGETRQMELVDTVKNPTLWSLENPHLYTVTAELYDKTKRVALDAESAQLGIRTISWGLTRKDGTNTFQLNGKPVLLNGIGEYEHNLGQSHAFTDGQIAARVEQIAQAGFNAFRDGHQPHNLRYGEAFERQGILWWSQMSAQIWYDTPAFRENFKQLLRDFVRERRNSPSVILWGLQNESWLPTEFARECTEIIRELDPTSSSQRLVTTCNGGTGTDWNVIQNWSGTYGGKPENYANEIKEQVLNGEYGAWRTLDWHSEGDFVQNGPLTEDRMTLLMEDKIRQIESVRDSVAGQFFWIFSSHDNPGRTQNGEGSRLIDRLGPYNYKGLLTPWGEPTDAYYLYRSNYIPADESPMVHIVSHTWPDRWTEPGRKSGLRVFSNCDSVVLYNGMPGQNPLGLRTKQGIGTPLVWDNVGIRYCLLTAVAIRDGQPVAVDHIVLNHLPEPPGMDRFTSLSENVTAPDPTLNYLYRVNCGGDTFEDHNGSVWLADRPRTDEKTWGSRSWADDFPGIPPAFGSQRRTFDPVWNAEWPLFQTFRYGRDKLSYEFPVPDGDYTVELYFMEPWYGRDRSQNAEGWRVFD
ncbi:MAG: beta galactosidase jelly roll domain-containing protein, partial [Alistipes sp.]|nr:beta galactosidase jelly roll domain-containing protein [Alistipes sp.]